MPVGKGSIERATIAGNQKSTSVLKSERFFTDILTEIPVHQILPISDISFDQMYIGKPEKDLMSSIQKFGIIEPVILRKLNDSQFQLLSGYRRLKVVKEIGMEAISSRVIEGITDEEAIEIYNDLHMTKTQDNKNLHEVKFNVVSKISSDMPAYLL